jgi:exonuclease III
MKEESPEEKFSVITFNILGVPFVTTHQVKNFLTLSKHFLARMRIIASSLNESESDIIMLQEVHLAMLLRFFKKHLTNYPYVAYKPLQSRARGGLVVFSKFPIEYSSFTDFHYRGKIRSKAAVTRLTRNGILFVKLEHKNTVLMNVYVNGDHDHLWTEKSPYHKIQQSQIEQLFILVNFFTQLGSNCIIGGDFNFGRHSPNYVLIKQMSKVTDPFASSNKPTYRKEFLPPGISSQVHDYIFMTSTTYSIHTSKRKYLFEKTVKVTKKKSIFLSDHIGLSLSVSFHPKTI